MLNERRRRVLEALIAEYVSSACPVGSRTLVERYPLGVSPATVRNELSVLEESGYIASPHVSAGRVPTDFGYRAFVDALLAERDLRDTSQDRIVQLFRDSVPQRQPISPDPLPAGLIDELQASAQELDDLVVDISTTLTRFTNCLSIVMAPSTQDLALARISLIPIDGRVVIMVLVTEDGKVTNRHVEFSRPVEAEHISHVEVVLNNVLVGKCRAQIPDNRDVLALDLLGDPVLNQLLEQVYDLLEEAEGTKVQHVGVSALLSQPEFSDSHLAMPIINLLDDNIALLALLRDLLDAQGEAGTTVRIGHENGTEDLADVSVVASRFGGNGYGDGVVAVVGPTRMDYRRTIDAVKGASRTLDETVVRGIR